MYTIKKSFSFSASHQLRGLPSDHQCARLHGHNYKVEIVLTRSTLSDIGFVVDYGELHHFKAIVDSLDHRHLNDIMPFNPTAENIAQWLYQMGKEIWPEVLMVRVSETDRTWAEYSE